MTHKQRPPFSDIRDRLPFFKMLFDHNTIGVIITDPEGVLVYYNDTQEKIDELEREAVLGRKLYDIYCFTPESSPGMQVLKTEKAIINGCHYYRTRSGKLVNGSCDIYPLHSEEGKLLGAICYVQAYSSLVTHIDKAAPHLPGRGGGRKNASAPGPGGQHKFASVTGQSDKIREALETARLAAQSPSPVMLIGETGVGKELFAQGLHYEGRRRGPYTAVNCSAVPETLLEGILFGTARGAFTGAEDKAGLFEVGSGGTLFLDELDSMPIGLQSKLLRVLQERRLRRVGDVKEREIDLKIISSVRSEPLNLIRAGVLRADFYYRLGVVRIQIPPLREREGDISLLIDHFLEKHSATLGMKRPRVSGELASKLCAHNWPGNVRELAHAIEAMLNIAPEARILNLAHLARACPELAGPEPPRNHVNKAAPQEGAPKNLPRSQQENEISAIRQALEKSSGNRSLAARLLGLSPQNLHYKIKKHAIQAADYVPIEI